VYRFLLSGRWVALGLVAVVVAAVCAQLGLWQFERLGERRADNATVESNLDAAAVPLAQLSPVDAPLPDGVEWRQVSLSGTYDADAEILVRYQTRGPLRGVDVVVPLQLSDGSLVLVDRGFLESPAGTPDRAAVPSPPAGTVEVTGWLRADSDAPEEATDPIDGTVRAVSSAALADELAAPLRAGWVLAVEEQPAAEGTGLVGPEEPDLGTGPHLYYGLQWLFFGFLALLGYAWFAYDEAHPRRRSPGREVDSIGRADRGLRVTG